MKGTVLYDVKDNVAVLTVDNPPVNPLSDGVRTGLYECVTKAEEDDSIKGIVVTGNGRAFIAGADISEFGGNVEGISLNEVFNKLEHCSKPVVAAINGIALGGGLETALCCNYRIAANTAFVGLPEVNLGLLPGGGGTQRLPRLAGPSEALKMMLTGGHIPAKKALDMGIVDSISENVVEDSIKFAIEKAESSEQYPKVRDLNEKMIEARGNDKILLEAQAMAAKGRKGQFAPGQIIKCVEAAINLDDFDEGLKKEGELFLECLLHPQREAMIHIFFGERAASKISDVPKETPVKEIKKAGIIGSGTMGGGIAMCMANAGISVTIIESSKKLLDRCWNNITANYQSTQKKGRLSQEQVKSRLRLIDVSLEFEKVSDADLVIEAVFENVDLKDKVTKESETVLAEEKIYGSNTSTIPISLLAKSSKRPQIFIGIHFFSPVDKMPLVEIIVGDKTSDRAIAAAIDYTVSIRKVPIVVNDSRGFFTSRCFGTYVSEGMFLLEEGVAPQIVERIAIKKGMPVGPLAVHDEVSLTPVSYTHLTLPTKA